VRLAAVVVGTLVVSPFLGVLMPDEPFHRVMTRIAQGGLLVAFLIGTGGRHEWLARLRAAGSRGPDRFRRATVVALALFGLILVVSMAMGGRVAAPLEPAKALWLHLLLAFAAATVIAVFEEIVFRGFLKDMAGGLVAAVVYAAIHYFRPVGGSAGAGTELDPLLGVKTLPRFFEPFGEPDILVGIAALFVFGLALNRMRDRTGTLYLGTGVHGGVVFALAIYRRWIDGAPAGDRWLYGGPRLYDGALPIAGLVALLALAHWCPMPEWMTRQSRQSSVDSHQ
jgi:membrane protease YdiL (CAAX protease family)